MVSHFAVLKLRMSRISIEITRLSILLYTFFTDAGQDAVDLTIPCRV